MSHTSHATEKVSFSNHVFTVGHSGELIDAKTYKPTGQNLEKCKNIIEENEKDFEIAPDGKIINKCDSSECNE